LFVLLLALAATKAVDTSLPDKAYIKRLRQTAKAETRGHRQLYKDLGTLGQGGAGNPNPGGLLGSDGSLLPVTTANEKREAATTDFAGEELTVDSRMDGTGSTELSETSESANRIIGGTPVTETTDYPFFVQWNRGCGGTLIDKDLVLTAAHCYDPSSNLKTVWVGSIKSQQGRQRTVVEEIPHPLYDSSREANDFMILRLDEETHGAIAPVTLNIGNNYRAPSNGEQLTVIGYGATEFMAQIGSANLMAATVNYISNCPEKSLYDPGVVDESIMFCAGVSAGSPTGQKDACQGAYRIISTIRGCHHMILVSPYHKTSSFFSYR